MVEGVGNIVYIFNRRPTVFKKLIMFLREIYFKKLKKELWKYYDYNETFKYE